jgi:hypothetical protein
LIQVKNCFFSLAFLFLFSGSLWSGEPALSSDARLIRLRNDTRALFAASAQRAPDAFKIAIAQLANRGNRIVPPLPAVDMSRVRVKSYAAADAGIWLVRETALNLQAAAIAWSVPISPSHGSRDLLAHAEQTFDYVLSHFTPEGTTGAPDAHLDKFIYVPLWESFILFGPDLPLAQRSRLFAFFTAAARYQNHIYPPATEAASLPRSPSGGFAKMDAVNMATAWLLIQTEAAALTGGSEFADAARGRIALIGQCMHGSTYDYVKNWNAAPGYNQIALDYLGRYFQLTHDPEALGAAGAVPLPLGDHAQVRYWKQDPWKGGSRAGPPIVVSQSWTIRGGRLEGVISVTATAACTLDEVRLSVVPTQPATEEISPAPGEILARVGGLCLGLASDKGAWHIYLHLDAPPATNPAALVITDRGATPPRTPHTWNPGDTMSAHVRVWLAPKLYPGLPSNPAN